MAFNRGKNPRVAETLFQEDTSAKMLCKSQYDIRSGDVCPRPWCALGERMLLL